jgi:MFS transporter, FSR family, fosmidomycin resistance protein
MGVVARRSRPALAGLLAALAVEFADELVDGTKSAAMPLIKHDLALTYLQVGLLVAVPLILGSLIELPVGVLSGSGRRRRRFVLIGGLVFIGAVLGAGLAGSFPVLLAALVVFFPASGAFVSLTQSALMDADPARRAPLMARWTLAGAAGSVAGPLLVAAVLVAGGSWRLAFILVALAGAVSWLAIAAGGPAGQPADASPADASPADASPADASPADASPADASPADASPADASPADDSADWPGLTAAIRISARAGAFRWLLLLEAADLLLDVFTAFLALYLVSSVHASPSMAALGVAIRLGAGLAGYAVLMPMLDRIDHLRLLRASVLATGLLGPAFLLVPGIAAKLALLAALSIATAPWYPVLMAELYASLPGRSGLAVSLSSAAGLAGAAGPLAVGLLAQHLGLSWAMAVPCVVPLVMLAAPAGARRSRPGARLS